MKGDKEFNDVEQELFTYASRNSLVSCILDRNKSGIDPASRRIGSNKSAVNVASQYTQSPPHRVIP